MTPTLPLELQLHIFELALPPLIRRNLDERVRLCKAFSLVHRSWTKTAQRELHEHLSVAYHQAALADAVAQDHIAAAKEGGWPLKRLEIDCSEMADDEMWLEPGAVPFGALTELWLIMGWSDSASFGVPDDGLERLHVWDDLGRQPPNLLISVPASITFLALHKVEMPTLWSARQLRQLRTLILDDVQMYVDWHDFSSASTSLQNLCCKGYFPDVQVDTFSSFTALVNAAIVLPCVGYSSEQLNELLVPLRLPPSLRTLALHAPSAVLADHFVSSVRDACAAMNISATIEVTRSMEDVKAWDPEEWAYSVGA